MNKGDIVWITGQGGGTRAIVTDVRENDFDAFDVEWKTKITISAKNTNWYELEEVIPASLVDYLRPLIENAAKELNIIPNVEYGQV